MIKKYQGNINPLLLDNTLDDRLFGTATDTDLAEIPSAFGFESVYPNPASSNITIRINTSPSEKITITLIDALGRSVLEYSTTSQTNLMVASLQVNHLAKGIYFVRIQNRLRSDFKSVVIH